MVRASSDPCGGMAQGPTKTAATCSATSMLISASSPGESRAGAASLGLMAGDWHAR